VRDWSAYVRARLSLPGLTPEREARVVRELAAQLEDFYQEAVARGASDADADAHACRQIRDWERMAQDVWLADRPHARSRINRLADTIDTMGGPRRRGVFMVSHIINDARYAVRQLFASPGFSTVAILTLALGIGVSSAMFSVINAVLLRPLPYPDPPSLVRVYESLPRHGRFSVAPATFLDWRKQNSTFEHLAAFTGRNAAFSDASGPEMILGAAVSWDLFQVLKVAPALGRSFTPEEDTPGRSNVLVLSDGLWQRRFGGDPAILGRSITVGGSPVTIIGVMPRGFSFPARDVAFWTPLAIDPGSASRGGHFLAVVGRTKPGIAVEQADADMRNISARLALQYPDTSAEESAEVERLHDSVIGQTRPALLTLLAAVGVLVLIACANVANLLLVRASIRGKEIAIRTALGAGRPRLVLQMLVESLVVAFVGGALGLALAYFAIAPIRVLSAGSIPRVDEISIDWMVLTFAFMLSLVTGVLFGLAPAWHAARSGLSEVLKEGGRSSAISGTRWVRHALLVGEVALSLVLLAGATLLIRSFARITSVDPGFQPERVLAFRVSLPELTYPEPHHRIAFYDRLLNQLEAQPQIASAGLTQTLPMRGDYMLSFTVEGRPTPKPGETPSANYRAVSPNFFRALGVPLLSGRLLTDRDADKAPMVALVDQAFVDRHFPGEDPLGRGIDIGNGTDGFYEIVGVVGNMRHDGLDRRPTATMYVPFKQGVFGTVWIVARTQGDPAQFSLNARAALREIDPTLPAFAMTPLGNVVSESVAQRRFSLLLLAVFAVVAVSLAAVGLYGVVAYSVSLRTQEIGVRIAIGAGHGDVMGLIVGGGMKLAMIGIALGLAGALALARLIETLLFEVGPFDPISYLMTAAVLLLVAAVACYVPARRAVRVDPVIALRG
jgi:putative ABC transport system permease protein